MIHLHALGKFEGPEGPVFNVREEYPLRLYNTILLDGEAVKVVSIERLIQKVHRPKEIVGISVEPAELLESHSNRHKRVWALLSATQQTAITDYLRTVLDAEEVENLRAAISEDPEGWWIGEHFFWGMGVRNELRKLYKDDELPPVDYGNGQFYRNWDDFYVAAIEEAVK